VRAAAYAVCVRDGAVLLAGGVDPVTGGTEWTLPGGGLDHGEQPHDGAVREVAEETGYAVRLDALLTVDAARVRTHHVPPYDLHAVRIIYAGTVVGGDLRFEVGGSTDRAAWVPLPEVTALTRADVIDVGLAAWERHRRGEPYSTSTP
jgi:8-oxo-dGTP diphosphatase